MLPADKSSAASQAILGLILGPLEAEVMDVLWDCGECSVREVLRKLDRGLAYTTVMSTLQRLFRKGLASRRMLNRAHLYTPSVTFREWQAKVARDVVTKLLAGPRSSREVLIACLLEAVDHQDETLLQQIERRMQEKRSAQSQSKDETERPECSGNGAGPQTLLSPSQ